MSNLFYRAKLRICRKGQRGAAFVLVVVAMLPLLGFAALAIDIGNLVVVRNELQNAADAGALAGARCLYNQTSPPEECRRNRGAPGEVYAESNRTARAAAIANQAMADYQKRDVEVDWTTGNDGDVQRGHWSFGMGGSDRGFTQNDSLDAVDLFNVSEEDLDANEDFINAIQVTTRRDEFSVSAFFAQIFGLTSFQPEATAVAYIGFAKSLLPGEADMPFALCKDKLLNGDRYDCSVGRTIPDNAETGGWTNFEPAPNPASCTGAGAGSASDLQALVKQGGRASGACSPGNPNPVIFGDYVSLNNGLTAAWPFLFDCWVQATDKERIWALTLPVTDCEAGQPNCAPIVGAVNVEVVWIQDSPPNSSITCEQLDSLNPAQQARAAPCTMGDWPATADPPLPANSDGVARWNSFAEHFGLILPSGLPATFENDGWSNNTMYFKPSCEVFEPHGDSGGDNFGVLAKIPRLVD